MNKTNPLLYICDAHKMRGEHNRPTILSRISCSQTFNKLKYYPKKQKKNLVATTISIIYYNISSYY